MNVNSNHQKNLIGILLINLGTPDSPKPAAVRKFLKQFLSDPQVVNLPKLIKWCLVNLLIIPFRTRKSSRAYQQIWTQQGSPLRVNSQNLRDQLSSHLGQNHQVVLGMRYGNPSIRQAMHHLYSLKVSKIIILPLFPQYADATTGSIQTEVNKIRQQASQEIPHVWHTQFFDHPDFIYAWTQQIQTQLKPHPTQHLLFSYHGLPVKQVTNICQQTACPLQQAQPCPTIDRNNHRCYRAQCYKTSQLIAQQLSLSQDQYSISFQSRLGKTPWIKPYTDEILTQLRNRNIEHLTIACPAFVADCLETLEEVDIQLRKHWQQLGGKKFNLIPCLNANTTWVNALANIVTQKSNEKTLT